MDAEILARPGIQPSHKEDQKLELPALCRRADDLPTIGDRCFTRPGDRLKVDEKSRFRSDVGEARNWKEKQQQQSTKPGEHREACEDPLPCLKSLSPTPYSLFTSCLEISLNRESPWELAQQGGKLLELLGARRPQLGARLHIFFPRRLKE